VRHEIVHNRHVVEELERQGAVFVEELDEIPGQYPVVFSAHGVPKSVPADAEERKLLYLDATCPLVSKVHREAEVHFNAGQHLILIGHAGHPEVIGTLGQVPDGAMTLIETLHDAETIAPADTARLAFLTQTTLSVDDTAEIVAALQRRFPDIQSPRGEDICYATSNRQAAVKEMSGQCDALLVIGAPNSSNSVRLVEVAERHGTRALLIPCADALDWTWLEGVRTLGLTAGASAPEILVRGLVELLATRFEVREREMAGITETMIFKLPRSLEAA
jgi:4-hydroxy-3-methylbut-2-enyl diphosphate reductase